MHHTSILTRISLKSLRPKTAATAAAFLLVALFTLSKRTQVSSFISQSQVQTGPWPSGYTAKSKLAASPLMLEANRWQHLLSFVLEANVGSISGS